MKLNRILNTPKKRVLAIVSLLGFLYSSSVYLIAASDIYFNLRGKVFERYDREYLTDYTKEFGPNPADCLWQFRTCGVGNSKLTKAYKAELLDAWQEMRFVKLTKYCEKVESSFPRFIETAYGSTREINTPFEYFKVLLEENRGSPNYHALRYTKRLINCYSECNCSKEEIENLGKRINFSEIISLHSTGFFTPTFKAWFNWRLNHGGLNYFQNEVFFISIVLLLLALGGWFDTLLVNFKKLAKK